LDKDISLIPSGNLGHRQVQRGSSILSNAFRARYGEAVLIELIKKATISFDYDDFLPE